MIRLSIIIPIYNVEKYIKQCFDSIVNQTYKNLEIICIDDCGTDNSIKIIEKFAEKDDRVKIIYNEKNSGASFSRNQGLKIASGDYIGFIDSDDFIELDYFEKMIKSAIETKLDIIQNNSVYYLFNNNKVDKIHKYKFKNIIFEVNNDNIYLLRNSNWDKIYKRSFLLEHNITFPENIIMSEDKCFNYKCIMNINKVSLISGGAYYYRQSQNSIMKKHKKNNDIIKAIEYIKQIILTNKQENSIRIPFIDLKNHLRYSSNKNVFFKQIKLFLENNKEYISNNAGLYTKKELRFFNSTIKSNNYFIYKCYYLITKIWCR